MSWTQRHLARSPERPARPSASTHLRKVVVAGTVGSVIEYFDYTIYAFLVTTLAVVFFPTQDPAAGLLSALAVFAASFVMRPVGGLLLGHVGDRFGRRTALTATVLGMGVATLGIGLLPSYQTIGVAAPVLLAALRCLQAVAAGGEVGGAGSFVVETSPDERRGFYGSTTQFGVVVGTALASLVVTLLRSTLTVEELQAWGWRIPFLLSLVLTVAAFAYRRHVEESPRFAALQREAALPRQPVRLLLSRHRAGVVQVALTNLVPFAGYYLVFTFTTTYATLTGALEPRLAGWAVLGGLVLAASSLPLWGRVSDRLGRRPVLLGACAAFAVFTYPLFWFIGTGPAAAVVGVVVLGQLVAAFLGVNVAATSEVFPTTVRASGFSLGFNLAAIAAGGTAPYIATWLIETTGDVRSPAFILVVTSVVSGATLLRSRETSSRPLVSG